MPEVGHKVGVIGTVLVPARIYDAMMVVAKLAFELQGEEQGWGTT
jgi:hypothetical protein